MRLRSPIGVLTFLIVSAAALAQTPRIDPAGIDGALLICGDTVSATMIDRFIDLAGGAKAKIAVVHIHQKDAAIALKNQLAASPKKTESTELSVIPWADAKAALPRLTGVWLITDAVSGKDGGWQETLQAHPLRSDFIALLRRSGVVATSGHNSHVIGDGLALLPPGLIDIRYADKKNRILPGVVAIQVSPGALLIKGRTLSAVGDEATRIYLAGSKTLPRRTITLQGKAQEDLTRLRLRPTRRVLVDQ